jgi:hypothetical protein
MLKKAIQDIEVVRTGEIIATVILFGMFKVFTAVTRYKSFAAVILFF